MAPSHRSIHPDIPGVPSWAAVLAAVIATAVGFAFDAGSANKELTDVFAAVYVVGCVAAVLAVRQSAIFTAVIQPPLILFCAVPGAYWLLHGARISGLKDLVINCGYPLIERFPLMLFTSASVLLIGMIRWYLGMAIRSAGAAGADFRADTDDSEKDSTDGRTRGIAAKLASILRREQAKPAHTRAAGRATPVRARRTDGPRRNAESTGGRPARRTAASRSRRVRPSLDDDAPDRTRRRRSSQPRGVDPAEPPRRSRAMTRRSSFDMYEPRRAPTGATPTHHPISQVRYRRAAPIDEAEPGSQESDN